MQELLAATAIAELGKAAIELAGSSDAAKRNTFLINFQEALIKTQSITASEQARNATLMARNQELEQEIVRLKDWESKTQKYELREVSTGIFARVEKGGMTPLKSAHKFCANCFEKMELRILQLQHIDVGRKDSLVCGGCKATVIFRGFKDAS